MGSRKSYLLPESAMILRKSFRGLDSELRMQNLSSIIRLAIESMAALHMLLKADPWVVKRIMPEIAIEITKLEEYQDMLETHKSLWVGYRAIYEAIKKFPLPATIGRTHR